MSARDEGIREGLNELLSKALGQARCTCEILRRERECRLTAVAMDVVTLCMSSYDEGRALVRGDAIVLGYCLVSWYCCSW